MINKVTLIVLLKNSWGGVINLISWRCSQRTQYKGSLLNSCSSTLVQRQSSPFSKSKSVQCSKGSITLPIATISKINQRLMSKSASNLWSFFQSAIIKYPYYLNSNKIGQSYCHHNFLSDSQTQSLWRFASLLCIL